MRNSIVMALLTLLLTSPCTLWAVPYDDLPFSVPEGEFHPLRALTDADFQKKLEKRLNKKSNWSRLIKQQKMAVGVVDLSDPDHIRFARVNGGTMIYAASLPKLAIMLAAVQGFEDGTLKETPDIINDLNEMIRKSDNEAANRVIDKVGLKKIEFVLEDPRYEFYDEDRGGGLWMGKRYAKEGDRNPDPLNGISHGATATQVCRFYYLLAMGRLVSQERSSQMLGFMVDPGLNHKFVNTLHRIDPDATLYRKSGTWKTWHSDSVMVWGSDWRRYILVALVDDPKGEQILRSLIPAVEDVLRMKKTTKP